MDSDTLLKLGAAWGALQAIAGFLTAILPKHTVVFKLAKAIVAGASRQPPADASGG